MRARSGGIAACGLVVALACTARADVAPPSLASLRAKSPAVAARYEAALDALDRGRYVEASRGFATVLDDVPGFAPALRRRCEAERELGHFERAVSLCRGAVDASPSAENLLALGHVLSLRGRGTDLERAADLVDRALRVAPWHRGALVQRLQIAALMHDVDGATRILERAEATLDPHKAAEAHTLLAHLALDAGRSRDATAHARRAVELDPDAYDAYAVLARVGLEADDDDALRVAAPAMVRLAPDGAFANYVAGVVAANEGRYGEAREYAQRARWLGMEPASCDALLFAIERRSPTAGGMLFPMGVALAVGSACFLALLLGGALLSRAALRRLGPSGDLARFEGRVGRALRVLYRRVLLGCIAYGYVFLPLMGALVAGAVAAALQVFLAAGTLHVGLAIALLLVGGFFLFAVIEAAFLRPRERPPSEILDLDENPRFDRIVRDVAANVGVRPIERVYVTPGTELAIFDQGSIGMLLRGRGKRTMHLGVALLDGLGVRQLEVLLAHEYGHLRREGSAAGGLASSVDSALSQMEQALRESGAATALNPVWLLLAGCRRALAAVSRGAIRMQEICADEWAARLYGGDELVSALRQVVATRARFEEHAYATLDEVVSTSRGLSNLYRYRTRRPPDEGRIADVIERRWNEVDGSHGRSSPRQRASRFSGVPADPEPTVGPSGSDLPAWSLFTGREALEMSMTDALRNDLARKGVRVSEIDEGDTPPDARPAAAVGE